MKHLALVICVLVGLSPFPALATQSAFKPSSSSICRDRTNPLFGSTTSYNAPQIVASSQAGTFRSTLQRTSATSGQSYDRSEFHAWADEDHDCMNTRHELLAKLSTRAPVFSRDHCRVVHGRWNDPYTGMVFFASRKMDIDHIVPLYWAWKHGADTWSASKRESFANDPRNLAAVDSSTNREKGAKGPLNWMPPNKSYQCQYLLRFTRIVKLYGLQLIRAETDGFMQMQTRLCR